MKQTTLLLLLFLLSCNQAQQPADNSHSTEPKTKIIPAKPTVFPAVKKLAEYPQTEFLLTLEHRFSKDKNAVYCVPILYAWDGLRKYINAPFEIDKKWQDLVLLNDSKSFVDVLKPEEYKIEIEEEDKGNYL